MEHSRSARSIVGDVAGEATRGRRGPVAILIDGYMSARSRKATEIGSGEDESVAIRLFGEVHFTSSRSHADKAEALSYPAEQSLRLNSPGSVIEIRQIDPGTLRI